jgi:hypothetical protein
LKKDPHEMGSEKGNVKIRRKIGCPQIVERIGSSGWIRTSNPPVNSNDGAYAPSLDTETCGEVDLMRS